VIERDQNQIKRKARVEDVRAEFTIVTDGRVLLNGINHLFMMQTKFVH